MDYDGIPNGEMKPVAFFYIGAHKNCKYFWFNIKPILLLSKIQSIIARLIIFDVYIIPFVNKTEMIQSSDTLIFFSIFSELKYTISDM